MKTNGYTLFGYNRYLVAQTRNHDLSYRQIMESSIEYADKVLETKGTGYMKLANDLRWILHKHQNSDSYDSKLSNDIPAIDEKIMAVLSKNGFPITPRPDFG